MTRAAVVGVSALALTAAPGLATASHAAMPGTPFISEIHYDNTGTDTGEFVEVQIPAGGSSAGLSVVLYNGSNGASYDTDALPAVTAGGAPAVAVVDYAGNFQNGAPDGVALVSGTTVLEFLSYEGAFAATNGPAAGLTSTDIGVLEAGTEPVGQSLSRAYDAGAGRLYWLPPAANTRGAVNPTLGGAVPATAPTITTEPSDRTVYAGETATLTVAADGTAPLHYQWYRGVAPDTSTPVGTDSATFTTPSLTETTSYWVRVSNSAGGDDSRTATMTVTPAACTTGPVDAVGQVQGAGATTPMTGRFVTVRGVVVGDYEGPSPALRGFYVQDGGDGDPQTSDGIFVFNFNDDDVALGDVVEVRGTAGENQGQTQISGNPTITTCGTGTASATDVTLPAASATEMERYEGMLLRFPQRLYVTEHFQLGRSGEVVVSSGGRLAQPTAVASPGADARAVQAANDLNRLRIDDATNGQNPDPIVFARNGQPLTAENTLRGGDTVTGATGVLTYTWGGYSTSPNAYRLRPVGALGGQARFDAENPRPAGPPAVGGRITVASANLLNFFNTFGAGCTGGPGGATMDCRGADNQAELDRQVAKTVAALSSMDADVVGYMEMENDGYGPQSAVQLLLDRLNQAGGDTWAMVQAAPTGTDAIRVGLLYKPASVRPRGAPATDTGSDVWDRIPVAQTFQASRTGEVFTVVVNHLKSKGSCPASGPDADQGDGAGCWNALRTKQAQRLAEWVASDPTGSGSPDYLLVGDFNSYDEEDPVKTLEAAGFTDLVQHFHGDDAYSYAFDGQWGYLDYAFASSSLVGRVTGAADYHINADEPSVLDYNTEFKSPSQLDSLYAPDEFRVSDHDPLVVGLFARDTTPPTVTPQVTGELGEHGWYTGDVTVTWQVEDESSFSTTGCGDQLVIVDTAGLTFTCTATSEGGQVTRQVTVKRDATAPGVQWSGGPADGQHYAFGTTPTAPTCAAEDTMSGPDACDVTGWSASVGTHVLTAVATDRAGNETTTTRTYTVDAWTLSGFFAPVDMGGVVNVVKGGWTVPLKWTVSAGDEPVTDVDAVSVDVEQVTCDPEAPRDAVESTTDRDPGLVYNETHERFVLRWKTPRVPGCRTVTVEMTDGSSLTALFRIRR